MAAFDTVAAPMEHHLVQLNIGRLNQPLDHPDSAEFVAALGPINALAEATPGFVWRLTDDDGQSSSYVRLPGEDDPLMIVNYSIWADLEALKHFMFKSGHASYLRRRREWFEAADEAVTVCWWAPAGTRPGLDEAYERLLHLRANGPSETGWPLTAPVDPPSVIANLRTPDRTGAMTGRSGDHSRRQTGRCGPVEVEGRAADPPDTAGSAPPSGA